MVRSIDMTYMQTVLGFFFGYILIAKVLLPLYYKLQLTSIYSYLDDRIGQHSYKTGASFFFLSKIVGAAARLYLVVLILQHYVFAYWNISFAVTVVISIFLVWLYTYRGGIKTIIWTDTLQALCLVAMLIVIIWQVKDKMQLDFAGMVQTLQASQHFRIFEFGDWHSTQHFMKQFFSGIFITIVMTGLDQDMMQKNLSCKSLKDAQKNMYTYGFAFTPVNFLFLSLGVLLLTLASQQQIELPALNDDILPMFCTSGILGHSILIFFTIGIIAAAFSSADSALTALTTSFCIDILGVNEPAADQFGKAMSVSDDLMWRYYELISSKSLDEIAALKKDVEEGRLHPKKAKEALAYEIVARYHGEDQAQEALQGFNSVFADGGIPDDAPEFACEHGEASKPPVFLTDSGLAASRGEAKRLIKQGSLSLDGERCDDAETPLEPGSYVVKLGKKRFLRLTVR